MKNRTTYVSFVKIESFVILPMHAELSPLATRPPVHMQVSVFPTSHIEFATEHSSSLEQILPRSPDPSKFH